MKLLKYIAHFVNYSVVSGWRAPTASLPGRSKFRSFSSPSSSYSIIFWTVFLRMFLTEALFENTKHLRLTFPKISKGGYLMWSKYPLVASDFLLNPVHNTTAVFRGPGWIMFDRNKPCLIETASHRVKLNRSVQLAWRLPQFKQGPEPSESFAGPGHLGSTLWWNRSHSWDRGQWVVRARKISRRHATPKIIGEYIYIYIKMDDKYHTFGKLKTYR